MGTAQIGPDLRLPFSPLLKGRFASGNVPSGEERRETAVFAGSTISHFLVQPALNSRLKAPFFASINSAPICLLICYRQILNIV